MSAAQWQFASSIAQAVLQFGVTILLARLLPPAAFGLVTLALIVIGFATLTADLGLGPSVIQHRGLTERHIRVAFTTTTALGACLTFVLYKLAPFGVLLLRDEAFPQVLRALAFVFLLAGVGSAGRALLQRELNFRGLFVIELTSYIVGYALVAVALALLGYGVWSLVFGSLVQRALASLMALLTVRHSIRPLLSYRELRDLLGFGTGASLTAVVNYVARNGDNMIVGRTLGPAALGLYGRAYTLMNLPVSYLAGILSKVLFPAFSEIHSEPERLGRAYLMAVQLTAIIAAPILFGMIVAAPHMIVGLYGDNWVGTVVPLQILCAAGIFRAVYHLGGSVAHATGNVFAELRRQVVYAVLVVAGSIVGGHWGISGVATGIAVAILFIYVAMAELVLRLTRIGWRDFFFAQAPGLLVGTVVGSAALLVRVVLERSSASDILIFGAILTTCILALPIGMYMLPMNMQPRELFARVSTAIEWAPPVIRRSINLLLRQTS